MAQSMSEETPVDSLINRAKKYRDDPSLVNKKTMQELIEDLEDLKGVVDVEDEEEVKKEETKGKPSLIIAIERGRK